jgi:hypothetical protein
MTHQVRKRIPGAGPNYMATSDGYVVRLAYTYKSTIRGKPVERDIPEKVLGGSRRSAKGYCRVNIEGRVHFLHRLIATAFVPNPLNLPQVNHKNGDKEDNAPRNLEWVSNLENRRHAVHTGLHPRGSKVSKRLVEDDVVKIRSLLASGVAQRVVAEAFEVCQQTVSHIARRSTWTHV